MKQLISTIILSVFGLLTILGFDPKITKASIKSESIKSVSQTTPLYLMHAKDIYSKTNNMVAQHYSHYSHESHASHVSHASHYSSW